MSHGGTISESHLMNVSSIHNYFHRKDEDDFMFLSKLVMSTYLLSVPPMGIMSESFSLCAPQRMMERCWFWWCDVWRVTPCHRCQVSRTWSRGTTTSNWNMTSGCRGAATSPHHPQLWCPPADIATPLAGVSGLMDDPQPPPEEDTRHQPLHVAPRSLDTQYGSL